LSREVAARAGQRPSRIVFASSNPSPGVDGANKVRAVERVNGEERPVNASATDWNEERQRRVEQ